MLAFASAGACGTETNNEVELGTSVLPLVTGQVSDRLRVLQLNVYMKPGLANVPPDPSPLDDIERAQQIGNKILSDADGYDVVLMEELFTDAAQTSMRDALKGTFQYHVIPKNNSGLAIFSRFPLERLNNPFAGDELLDVDASAPGDTTSGGKHSHFAYTKYKESCSPDNLANKGALLARVVTPKGNKRYNVVVTHTQSDDTLFTSTCSQAQVEAVRKTQLEQAAQLLLDAGAEVTTTAREQTLIGGDLNVQGWLPRFSTTGNVNAPPSTMLAAEYGTSLWGGGAFLGIPMYDPWRLTSDADDGATYIYNEVPSVLQRLDYILFNGGSDFQPGGNARVPLTEKSFCPQWVRRTMTDVDSDHYGVALEVGPGGRACSPWQAGAPSELIPVNFYEAGADYWVYVANPGTYSVGLPDSVVNAGVRADVFLARNLGARVTKSAVLAERRMPVEKEYGTYKPYAVSEPVYIRFHAPNADVTGSFVASVVRHRCATEADACELVRPGQLSEYRVPVGVNNVRRGYFVHATPAMASGSADLAFQLTSSSPTATGRITVSGDVKTRAYNTVGNKKLDFTTADPTKFKLVVEEFNGTSNKSFGISYDTNATLVASFLGDSSKVRFYVGNETGIGVGSDESRCWLRPGSETAAAIGTAYEDNLDSGRSLFITAEKKAFRNFLFATCTEFVGGDGGGIDNAGFVSVPALPFGTPSRLSQKGHVRMGESGDYELQYSLVKRLP